jgi:lipopolysaccharide biosynthesis glycosyltransferase
MQVAFGADNHYVQHLAVAMASFLSNLQSGIVPHIYVMTDGISVENQKHLDELKNLRPFSLSYLVMSKDEFANYPPGLAHISHAAYFRLRLPAALPAVDKILYLDIDTVTDGDIYPLWETHLSAEEWIAASLELEVGATHQEAIGLSVNDPYINSGVMLMNLSALRNNQFEEKCIAFAVDYHPHIRHVDQDVINTVCRGHIKIIDPRYNMVFSRYYHAHRLKHYKSDYTTVDALKNALKNPVVIHYVGGQKPWFYGCRHHLASRYRHYLFLTPWKNYRYPDKSLRVAFSKYTFFLRQWWKHRHAFAELAR